MYRKRSLFKILLLLALLGASVFFMSSCGGGGFVSAPPGATITITPSTVSITDGTTEPTWHTQYFTISVKNSKGDPLGDIEIWISYPLAVPDSAGVVQLYDGNTPVNSPFKAKTDDFGVYQLRFDYQLGVGSYKGNLEVRSGSAFGSASFDVSGGGGGGGTGQPMSISPTAATVAGIQNPDSNDVDNLTFTLSNVAGQANCISSQPAIIASPGLHFSSFEIDPDAVTADTLVTITCTDDDGFVASALVTVTPPGLSISLNPIHVIGRANPPGGDGDITDDVLVEVIGGVGPYIVNIEPFSLTTIVPGGPWPSAVPWTFLVDPTNVSTNTVVTFKVTDGIGTTASANLVVYTENTGLVANTDKENVIGLLNPEGNAADDVTISVAGANNPFIVSWVCGTPNPVAATPASPVVVAGTSGTVTFDPDRNIGLLPKVCTVNVTDNLGSAATLNVTVWP